VKFAAADASALRDVARRHEVQAVPTTVILRGEDVLESLRGFTDAETLEGLIQGHLADAGTNIDG
jgi:thioredoxin-like negative regulator of GroEL